MNKHFFYDVLGIFFPKTFPNKEYEANKPYYEDVKLTADPTPHCYPTSDPDKYDWKLLDESLGIMLYEVPTPTGTGYVVYDSVLGKERRFYELKGAYSYMRGIPCVELEEKVDKCDRTIEQINQELSNRGIYVITY